MTTAISQQPGSKLSDFWFKLEDYTPPSNSINTLIESDLKKATILLGISSKVLLLHK